MLLFAVAGSARAQDNPKGEIAGNYTYIHINPGGFATVSIDCHGGGGSAAWSLNHYLGVVGEFSGCKWTGFPGLSAHTFTYLFGPRLTYRAYGRLEPFGEVLLGGAHIRGMTVGFSGSGSDTAFAMAIGGGADYKWKPSVAIRFIQADYLYSRLGGTKQNNFRLQAGVVFRFGGR
jgi:opacity protein-like surface antigen